MIFSGPPPVFKFCWWCAAADSAFTSQQNCPPNHPHTGYIQIPPGRLRINAYGNTPCRTWSPLKERRTWAHWTLPHPGSWTEERPSCNTGKRGSRYPLPSLFFFQTIIFPLPRKRRWINLGSWGRCTPMQVLLVIPMKTLLHLLFYIIKFDWQDIYSTKI